MFVEDGNTRRAGYFGEQQRGGQESGYGAALVPSTPTDDSPQSSVAQSCVYQPYSQEKADERRREALARIKSRTKQRIAAKYFYRMERMG